MKQVTERIEVEMTQDVLDHIISHCAQTLDPNVELFTILPEYMPELSGIGCRFEHDPEENIIVFFWCSRRATFGVAWVEENGEIETISTIENPVEILTEFYRTIVPALN